MIEDDLLRSSTLGLTSNIRKWPDYIINGYKFVKQSQNEIMSTTNHHVQVKGGQTNTHKTYYNKISVDIV